MKWYYYLHTNGDLIGKNPVAVDSDPSYFDSPFVKRWWLVDTEDRGTGWRMLTEALANGAELRRAAELVTKWEFTKEDSFEFVTRVDPTPEMRKGLDLYITQILKMDADVYWERFKAWGKAHNGKETGNGNGQPTG